MSNILKSRYHAEKLFKYSCLTSLLIILLVFVVFILSITFKSYQAFLQPYINLELNPAEIKNLSKEQIETKLILALKENFNKNKNISDVDLVKLISIKAYDKIATLENINKKQQIWLPASALVGNYLKERDLISNYSMLYILDKLKHKNLFELEFNADLLFNSDSREVEIAGIAGGFIGSIISVFICMIFAVPIGIFSAIYLEEYAKNKKLKHFLEVNINNLAAVPSIVYGLIGLAVLLNTFKMPRSSPISSGILLAILVLPMIIITTRQSIRSVPKSIKYAALALGATPLQTSFHHILPVALPSIITGCILSLSRALGETAPLIMIGMVAFIPDLPKAITDPITTLPVLIYTWVKSPEYGFIEKTSAAILVLLMLITGLNYLAITIRNKYEIKF